MQALFDALFDAGEVGEMGELQSPPKWLIWSFGGNAEGGASVQRDGFKLDVEAVAVVGERMNYEG